jgi:hypothetical protein
MFIARSTEGDKPVILNRRGLNLMAMALMSGALPVGLSADEEPARSEPIPPPYFPPPKREPPPPTPEQIKAQAKRRRKVAKRQHEEP